ncbi:hypothetical protein ACTPEM_26530, partial [Clostridioides difficile]
ALTISKYVVMGMVFAGFITTIFPNSIIQKYLGNPGLLSLGSIGDYPIYKHINDFERILNRKRIESVNIVTSNSNISNILDLPN